MHSNLARLAAALTLAASCSSHPPSVADSGVCTDLQVDCAGHCAQLSIDDANCGACGTACPADQGCAGGVCYPRMCGTLTCASSQVCVADSCVDRSCFGVLCPQGQACGGGQCYPTDCGTAACNPGEVCVQGACIEATCAGVICPTGLRCAAGVCVKDTCGNGFKDGTESDADCGGVCAACGPGRGCASLLDCDSLVCIGGTCVPPSCRDGVRNGTEGDVDCGAPCPSCATGKRCSSASQCESAVCAQGTCRAATCTDVVLNGDESDVDCGGSCLGCAETKRCRASAECLSGLCVQGRCVGPQCTNLTKDGAESDVDCGGGACAGCADGKACNVGADCTSQVCDGGSSRCQAPSCTDTVQNGAETDVNCGGGTCPACINARHCKLATDCASLSCVAMVCTAPSCTDATRNAAETDVDCGGGSCPRCGTGQQCGTGGDCQSTTCDGGHCAPPGYLTLAFSLTAGSGAQDLLVKDLDADGRLDLAVANEGSFDVSLWWGNGDGGFTQGTTPQVSGAAQARGPHGLAAGDVDGDGKLDLVLAREYGVFGVGGCTMTILRGAGNRGFIAAFDTVYSYLSASGCGHRMATGRLNSDTRDDIVASDNVRPIYMGAPDHFGGMMWLGSATNDYSAAPLVLPQAGPWVLVGDVNGDGSLDIVGHSGWYSTFRVWLGMGNGSFAAPISGSVAAGDGDIALARMTGDTALDLVVATKASGRVGVGIGVGDGNFLAPNSFPVAAPDGVAVADIDGDGLNDVIVGATGVAVLLGNGDGSLKPAQYFATQLGDVGDVETGDFNGDGRPDVAAMSGDTVYVLFNTRP